ncbi:cell division protein FtsZ [Brevibacillus dissolubilis]|uniref:cell division protein FtsZ n=1 Tax=Brevibacillus dissolubilis TaxID=1844116 RepID=UPI00159B9842|nr:cell division protein FtsZ [Brevibacillus dissolubilis]
MTLMNSKELEYMTANEYIRDISIRFGVIGAGQKGNKDADIFAGYKFTDGTPCYPTLAVNFAQTDMTHLQHIPQQDRIHFDGMRGAARTPSLVVERFDPAVNPQANQLRSQLALIMEQKFSNVDHLLVTIGAGGGVGTGWASLTLQLIREGFFPVPVTFLISLPFDDMDEIANALLLLEEIKEFLRIQNELFDPNEPKPLASVILTDNKKIYHDFELKKGTRQMQNKTLSWKDEGNHAIVSTLHELNLIPANFGSDNVTYDPSDLLKLIQLSGGFLTVAKARLEPDFTLDKLEAKMMASIHKGYFSCGHRYRTATMYGGFVLRPSSAEFFKDIKTEAVIKKVIAECNPLFRMRGKYGDPIWNEGYAVIYTIFAGMTIPDRFSELAEELKQFRDARKLDEGSSEKEVDLSAAIESVGQSSFNPYQKKANAFGGSGWGSGRPSVFSRQKQSQSQVEGTSVVNRFARLRDVKLHDRK